MRRQGERYFGTVIILFVTLNIVFFSVMVMTSADDLKVQYIPDDAFYYLTLSRNFSSFGLWTFDSGISVTSGFHPLFAYLLSSAYSLLPLDTNSFLTCSLIFSLSFALAAIVVMCFWGFKYNNVLFLMLLALVISNRNFVYNTISVTEWSLTILISSLYGVWYYTKYRNPVVTFSDFLVLFVLGALGSMARLDFGLFPFSIFFGALVLSFVFKSNSRRKHSFALVGLLGALIGLLIVFVHNYIFMGVILQSSAKMKAYWTQLEGAPYYAVPLLITLIIGFSGLILIVILTATAILSRFFKKADDCSNANHYVGLSCSDRFSAEAQSTFSPHHRYNFLFILTSTGVCILGYVFFYSRNAAIMPWYTVNLLVPVLMFLFAISNYITASLCEKTRYLFFLLFILMLIFNISKLYPISTAEAPWPHQKFMYDAGIYLRENFPDCHVGAWNAGIIGYYQGGRVINLDGLVNNDIYIYTVNNDLPEYISSRDICYILDFENMLTIESLRVRGGYDDPDFLASLEPVKVFDEGEYRWRYLTLYNIVDPQY